jgi:type I restriction enzyme S subunit
MSEQITFDKYEGEEYERVRLKHLARINPSKSEISDLPDDTDVSFVPLEGFGTKGTIKESEVRPLGEVYQGYTYFRKGDIAIAKITPSFENGKGAMCHGLKNDIGFGTTELHILRPRQNIHSKFLWYALRSKPFMDEAEASMRGVAGQQRVPSEFLKNYRIPLMPLSHQKIIASYLERESTKVDKLIQKMDVMITRVENQWEAIEERAVTKGIGDEDFETDKRLDVLKERPSSWDVKPAKALFKPRDDRGYDDLPLLEVSINHGVRLRDENEDRNAWVASDLGDMKRVAPGDLVYNKMRFWQGAIGYSTKEGLVSPDYTVLEPQNELNVDYFRSLLRTEAYKTEVYRRSYGVVDDRKRIYWTQFGDIPLLLPPIEDQKEIAEYILKKEDHIKSLNGKLEEAIEKLKEKRQAHITKAVTGQINIDDLEVSEQEVTP